MVVRPSNVEEDHQQDRWLLITVSTSVLICIVAVLVYVTSKNYLAAAHASGQITQLQNQLDSSELVLNLVPSGIGLYGITDGSLVRCNEALSDITDRRQSELLGKPMTLMLPHDVAEEVRVRVIGGHLEEWERLAVEPKVNEALPIERPDGSVVVCRAVIRGVEMNENKRWLLILTPLPEVLSNGTNDL